MRCSPQFNNKKLLGESSQEKDNFLKTITTEALVKIIKDTPQQFKNYNVNNVSVRLDCKENGFQFSHDETN